MYAYTHARAYCTRARAYCRVTAVRHSPCRPEVLVHALAHCVLRERVAAIPQRYQPAVGQHGRGYALLRKLLPQLVFCLEQLQVRGAQSGKVVMLGSQRRSLEGDWCARGVCTPQWEAKNGHMWEVRHSP